MEFLEIIKAEHVDGHRIHIWFNNQTDKTVDLSSSLQGSIFEPLKDIGYFKKFAIKFNTLEWENGADFAPEYLYGL